MEQWRAVKKGIRNIQPVLGKMYAKLLRYQIQQLLRKQTDNNQIISEFFLDTFKLNTLIKGFNQLAIRKEGENFEG